MKALTQEQYEGIVTFIQGKMMTNTTTAEVDVRTIVQIADYCTYEQYLQTIAVKGKKVNIKQFLTGDWKAFWNTWPSTKSVPGTEYKSGAKMKGAELKMHEKWYNAIDGGKITIQQMQYAAECYLQWAYADSKRLGRNELQYRSGLEPWLNQEQYYVYMNIEMPKEVQVKMGQYTEA